MSLSRDTIGVLVDLIENKLSMMQIGDREELREIVTLQHSLKELQTLSKSTAEDTQEVSRRGRRRKLSSLIEEYEAQTETRLQA